MAQILRSHALPPADARGLQSVQKKQCLLMPRNLGPNLGCSASRGPLIRSPSLSFSCPISHNRSKDTSQPAALRSPAVSRQSHPRNCSGGHTGYRRTNNWRKKGRHPLCSTGLYVLKFPFLLEFQNAALFGNADVPGITGSVCMRSHCSRVGPLHSIAMSDQERTRHR